MPIDKNTEAVLKLLLQGDKQVTEGLKKVKAEMGGLDDAATGAAGGTDKLKESTDKATASEGDFAAALSAVSPELAGLVGIAGGAARAFTSMGDANIFSAKTMGTVRDALSKNIGLLKFFGAATFVVVGIKAITAAFAQMRKEAEDAAKAIEHNTAAANERAKTAKQQAQDIAEASGKGRATPVSMERAAQLQQIVHRAQKLFPGMDEGALRAMQGMLQTDDPQELARFAEMAGQGLISPAEGMPRGAILKGGRATFDKNRGAVKQGLRNKRPSVDASKLIQELFSQGGSTEEIETLLKQLPGQMFSDLDPGKAASVVQALGGIDQSDVDKRSGTPFFMGIPGFGGTAPEVQTGGGRFSKEFRDLQALRTLVEGQGVSFEGMGQQEVLQTLTAAQFAVPQIKKAVSGGSTTVNVVNPRITIPGGGTPRTNGQTTTEDNEGGF